ncbi:MAG TPA: hypothetical protein DCZ20_11705 [Lachnospiraceae bacterium]|nr:hypothetical protein [Lachnospiraceae bacterium]
MLGIGKEAAVFAEAFLAGFFVWGVYTAIRIFRRIISHNLVWIALEDLVYWISMALFLFMQMYHSSDGSIRWYFVLGVIAGAIGGAGMMRLIAWICRKICLQFRRKRGKGVDNSGETR